MKVAFARFIVPVLAAVVALSGSAPLASSAGGPDTVETGPAVHTANIPGYDRYSSPVLADIDGDGKPEVLVGTEAGYLVAMKYQNGALQTLWQTYLGASIGSSPAVADLDGDGQKEIALGVGWAPPSQRGRIVILNHNGTLRCQRTTLDRNMGPDGIPDGVFGTPALGDVDGDGTPEVVVAGYDEELYVLRNDCSDLAVPGAGHPWPYWLEDNTWGSPALADINHDGRMEIVIGYYYHEQPFCPDSGCGSLSVLDYKGDELPGWPRLVYTHLDSSPAVADIDNDGQYEIVIGTGQNTLQRFSQVYAFRSDGSNEPGWPQYTNGWVWSSPTIADVDGDGYPEIFAAAADIVSNGQVISHGKLYGWKFWGDLMPNWPVTPIDQNGLPEGVATASSPTIVDADDDGQPEIFITSGWDIAGFKVDGTPLNSYRLHTLYSLGSTPAWGDLEGDGQLEAVIGGGDYHYVPSGLGTVYVWSIGTTCTASNALWPMWRRDAARTGLVKATPNLLVSPTSLVVMHDQATGSTTSASFNVRSSDGSPLEWRASASNSRVSLQPARGSIMTGSGNAVQVGIDTSSLGAGWHDLGTVTVNASTGSWPAGNSPTQFGVKVFVGTVHKTYLLVVRR